ncbi:MAG: tetratricopeptide repeat protein [Lentimicrobiaceae bacterium]|nr:tetratricopeptide repeat protein [Lentimicrobiaceae bacterium]
MTQKEKSNYAIGIILGEKLQEKITESGIDLSIIENLKEMLKEKVDLAFIKEGFRDRMKGECKLSKEEIGAVLVELEQKKEYIEGLINKKKESDENGSQCSINYQHIIALRYSSIAYYYLFIKEYVQAEQAAHKALELDPDYLLAKTNLAHALLFQNRFSKAEAIYKELSQTIYQNNETYSKVLLNDFAELENAGAIPEKSKADVEKIKQMLLR